VRQKGETEKTEKREDKGSAHTEKRREEKRREERERETKLKDIE
jgi:hypothetical protein